MRKIDLNNLQAASSETARDINRRIVLNLIRSRQPISRADLARSSGLQRSTVSVIVDQLIKEGWVVEGLMGRLPRGRRPIYLRLNARRAIIGIDIRPSRTIIATADINAHFDSQEILPTPADPRKAVKQLAVRVQHLIRSRPGVSFEASVSACPGGSIRSLISYASLRTSIGPVSTSRHPSPVRPAWRLNLKTLRTPARWQKPGLVPTTVRAIWLW